MRTFVTRRLAEANALIHKPHYADCAAVLPVVVSFVPRPDNDYNPRAISVAMPPGDGGSPLDRHIGYLYESQLRWFGGAIHRLATVSAGPVGCHGWIELYEIDEYQREELERDADPTMSEGELLTPAEQLRLGYSVGSIRLNLPDPADMPALVDAYELSPAPATPGADAVVAAQPAGAHDGAPGVDHSEVLRAAYLTRLGEDLRTAFANRAATGAWWRPTARSMAADRRAAEAEKRLERWSDYRRQQHRYRGLRAISHSVYGFGKVLVVDEHGARVGEYHLPDGPLTLTDERVRPDALRALTAHGITPKRGQQLAGLDDFPDALVLVMRRTWSIRAVQELAAAESLPEIGTFEPESGRLIVYAAPYREPVMTLIRRHGHEPATVNVAAPSRETEKWNQAASGSTNQATAIRTTAPLRAELRRFIPAEHLACVDITWLTGPTPEGLTWRTRSDLENDSYYVRELTALFGGYRGEVRLAPCRLCGGNALAVGSALPYCFGCCRRAQRGILQDNGVDGPWVAAATWAIRRLAEIEFSGPPSLAQLTRLTVTDAGRADEAMLCRFLIPRPEFAWPATRHHRKPYSWSEWLARAGLLREGMRTARGTRTVATDGHLCRSLFERHVDDFFHHWDIAHDIEPHYPYDSELNTTGLRADWRLADGTFVEALGLPDEKAYAAKVERKLELARRTGIRVVTITADDLSRLSTVFAPWLTGVIGSRASSAGP
ncbi:hypothetical protein HC031_29970 [Planosporangium thailandense]|uniref:DUF559 domain-containing protein n=1 Tax=Planosporangium thailandense TaxID=765197 RepID=A0ABX0Y7C4_9ACTN|nr:hypothetical protein [Planosporangium thailandense]NJC73908.1 hypothetical protein [Planosporangium thailandense]